MDVYTAITTRHGVLRYKPDPVEPEKIEQVLQAAISAPSPANTQPWAFIVVTDPALTVQVAQYLMGSQAQFVFRQMLEIPEDFNAHLMRLYESFDRCPCFIVVCRQQRVNLAGLDFQPVLRDWDIACLGAAMGNLMTMATGLGLGTRWFGGLVMDAGGEGLTNLLGIPPGVEIVGVTPLGYHDEPRKDRPVQDIETLTGFVRGDKHKLAALLKGKLPLSEVVSTNHYGGKNT